LQLIGRHLRSNESVIGGPILTQGDDLIGGLPIVRAFHDSGHQIRPKRLGAILFQVI
jgi:hypothetical protein